MIFLVGILTISCAPNSESTATKKAKPTAGKNAERWVTMKAQLGINDAQIEKIKKVERTFNARKRKLKKEKKWTGPANRPGRAKFAKDRRAALRKNVGKDVATKYLEHTKES